MTLASMPKCPSVSSSVARHLLLAGGVGLGRLAGRARQEPRRRDPPHEVGVVGDRGAVAALRREVLGSTAPRGPSGSPRLGRRPVGDGQLSPAVRIIRGRRSAGPRASSIGGASTWVARTTSSEVSGSGGNSGSGSARARRRAPRPGRQPLETPGRGRRPGRRRRRAAHPGGLGEVGGRPPDGAARRGHAGAGGPHHAGERRAGDQDQPGERTGTRPGCRRRASRSGAS